MSLEVSDTGSDFKSVQPGAYIARCVRLIDIGTQHSEYQGKPISKRQIVIAWELPTEIIEEGEAAGKPYMVSKFYTASLNEKANLRKDLSGWRGKEFTDKELEKFDLKAILGKGCMVNIIHTDKGRAKIAGIMAMPKESKLPPQVNPSVAFDIDSPTAEAVSLLYPWEQKFIDKSEEMQHGTTLVDKSDTSNFNVPDVDEIPFS
jgi:hypothetical protein